MLWSNECAMISALPSNGSFDGMGGHVYRGNLPWSSLAVLWLIGATRSTDAAAVMIRSR